jgi:tetratricopeptide (TPR) repeat protein
LPIYLGALRESGKLGKAGKVYEKLKAQPSKSHEVYIETIKFDLLNENYTEANLTIAEAIQVFPKSVELFLLKAKIDIYKEDYEGLQQTLKAINAMNSQSSIYYYSRYLEYFGLLSVSQGKNELATQLFKKALKNFESPELRSKLAQLQSSNATGEISDLILKSKSIDLMNKAKSALREEDLNAALNYAISAVDTSKNYSPAQVLLAKIQIEKGFYEIAISSLEELTKRDSLDPVSNFALIRAYVKSFKFSKAKTHLSLLANTKLKDNSEYPAVVSELFLAVGDFLQAVTWLTKTIQLNPLNEKYYYKLAKVFLDNKKFDKAKSMITRAIDLSPNNPSFRVLYSNIIYEMDNVETAIGYLRGLENDFIDDPEINGQIAIYYFKSGQLNLFQEQKNKMESSPKKTTKLYKFLIDSSIIDEKFDDVIKYGEELLSLNPGDLETRMLLGKIYFEKGTEEGYKESLKQFNSVKQRLPTYPKLLYYIGRINLMIGRVDEAIALANKEMKANPELEETYILLGEIYLEQKKFVEAERYYKEAQKRNSRSVDALLGLAYISSKKNQYEIALDLYKKAQTMAQQKVEIHKYLGDTYRNLGQGKLAIESYKVYLELVPESKYRKEIENYIRLLK